MEHVNQVLVDEGLIDEELDEEGAVDEGLVDRGLVGEELADEVLLRRSVTYTGSSREKSADVSTYPVRATETGNATLEARPPSAEDRRSEPTEFDRRDRGR